MRGQYVRYSSNHKIMERFNLKNLISKALAVESSEAGRLTSSENSLTVDHFWQYLILQEPGGAGLVVCDLKGSIGFQAEQMRDRMERT
ncbi:MAG TPA: hypothetical protein VNG91_00860 [Terriglobia bacterium]|nr:hypothetical protein [Terriglobia bacterium]